MCRRGNKYRIADSGNGLTSDKRLKKDIQELTNVTQRIKRLKTVSFKWNNLYEGMYGEDNSKQIGVLAQNLQKEFPELVVNTGEYFQVKYRYLPVLSLAAIKELQQKIETIQNRLARRNKSSNELRREISSLKEENKELKKENQQIKDFLCLKHKDAPFCN